MTYTNQLYWDLQGSTKNRNVSPSTSLAEKIHSHYSFECVQALLYHTFHFPGNLKNNLHCSKDNDLKLYYFDSYNKTPETSVLLLPGSHQESSSMRRQKNLFCLCWIQLLIWAPEHQFVPNLNTEMKRKKKVRANLHRVQ